MAPLARIERALTCSGVNSTWGPMIVVAARSAVVILALRTVDHLTPLETAARCVSGVVLCCHKCSTRRRMDATAHARGCPVAPCLIDSPLMPFLRREEEANKGGGGTGGGGSCGGWGELFSHKELDVAQVEGGGDGVCPAGAEIPGWRRKKKAI